MEKLYFLCWSATSKGDEDYFAGLRRDLPAALGVEGARDIIFCCRDAIVRDGTSPSQCAHDVAPDVAISFWMDSAVNAGGCVAVLDRSFDRIHGYLVSESTILAGEGRSPGSGDRSEGFRQIASFRMRSDKTREEFFAHWLGHHTRVAVETQSTFFYVQNVVVRILTKDTPEIDAIVDESFPLEALTNAEVYYDAVGDEERFNRHVAVMIESAIEFIDFESLTVIATSEYVT